MQSLDVLNVLLSGFGWAFFVCLLGVVAALFTQDFILTSINEQAIDYDGLEVEEIMVIEEARAELARKARERAAKAQQEAEAAQFEAWSEMAAYTPIWQVQPLTQRKRDKLLECKIWPADDRTFGALLRAV